MEQSKISFRRQESHSQSNRHHSFKKPVLCAAGILIGALIPNERPQAAGFALKEQSGTALGNAFAGSTAGAEDLSYMFFNPAALTRQEGHQAASVLTVVLPSLKPHNASASTINGDPITGNNGGDAGKDAKIPALYAMWDISQSFDLERDIRFGFGVNVPFGLETKYNTDWVGRYHALDTSLETIALSPTLAVEVIDGVSIGAGFIAQYADARLTTAIDFSTILGAPGTPDGRGKVTGNDWAFGFNAGLLAEPWEGTRFGVGYRSEMDHNLQGDGTFRVPAGLPPPVNAAFSNSGAEANLVTPESVSFGAYHDIDDQWSIMGEAVWTRWSRFEDLRIKFNNPATPSSFTDQDWESVWFFAVGGTYRPTPEWTIRFGAAHDQSPTRNSTRTPRVPDSDRTWLAFGAGYQPSPGISLDFGYTHIFMRDPSINLDANDPGNANRGNLAYESRNHIDLITFQATIAF